MWRPEKDQRMRERRRKQHSGFRAYLWVSNAQLIPVCWVAYIWLYMGINYTAVFGLNMIILIHYGSRTVVGCVFKLVGWTDWLTKRQTRQGAAEANSCQWTNIYIYIWVCLKAINPSPIIIIPIKMTIWEVYPIFRHSHMICMHLNDLERCRAILSWPADTKPSWQMSSRVWTCFQLVPFVLLFEIKLK